MSEVWTYIDASTIEIAGDSTIRYWPNLLVSITQTTTKYFIITAVNLVSGNTRLTLNGCGVYTVANAAITAHGVTANQSAQGIPASFGRLVPDAYGTITNHGIIQVDMPDAAQAVFAWRKGGVHKWSIYMDAYSDDLRFYCGSTYTFPLTLTGNKIGINNEVAPAATLTVNGGCNIGGNTDPGDNNLAVVGDVGIGGNISIDGTLKIKDGITAPDSVTGYAQFFVDSSDGDLKIKFSDGTTKTITVDT